MVHGEGEGFCEQLGHVYAASHGLEKHKALVGCTPAPLDMCVCMKAYCDAAQHVRENLQKMGLQYKVVVSMPVLHQPNSLNMPQASAWLRSAVEILSADVILSCYIIKKDLQY